MLLRRNLFTCSLCSQAFNTVRVTLPAVVILILVDLGTMNVFCSIVGMSALSVLSKIHWAFCNNTVSGFITKLTVRIYRKRLHWFSVVTHYSAFLYFVYKNWALPGKIFQLYSNMYVPDTGKVKCENRTVGSCENGCLIRWERKDKKSGILTCFAKFLFVSIGLCYFFLLCLIIPVYKLILPKPLLAAV